MVGAFLLFICNTHCNTSDNHYSFYHFRSADIPYLGSSGILWGISGIDYFWKKFDFGKGITLSLIASWLGRTI
jgi:hypothetical protein